MWKAAAATTTSLVPLRILTRSFRSSRVGGGGGGGSSRYYYPYAKQVAVVSAISAATFAAQWILLKNSHENEQQQPADVKREACCSTQRASSSTPFFLPTPEQQQQRQRQQQQQQHQEASWKNRLRSEPIDLVPRLMSTHCDSEDGSGTDGGSIGNLQAQQQQHSTDEYGDETFFGQCLQRQLYRPKLPYPAWDYDWDHRETEATSQQALSAAGQFAKSRHLGKTRHILLIRHGQYDERYKDDRRRRLTPLGRHQAELTGQRLAVLARGGLGTMKREFAGPLNIKCIHVSDMERAKETARIIASHLPHVKLNEPDPMLNEALPSPMIPIRPDVRAIREIDANHSRIEAAFQKYIHRADLHEDEEHETYAHQQQQQQQQHPQRQPPSSPQQQPQQQQQQQHRGEAMSPLHHHDSDHHHHHLDHSPGFDPHTPQDPSHCILPHPEHEFEILVGHGNIIRYFFCRALQLPPEAWLRISTFNCSITYLMIYPNGYVSCRMLGDVGHLGYDNSTFSGSYGYNW